jgi:hypothetical protein
VSDLGKSYSYRAATETLDKTADNDSACNHE